MNRHSFVNTPAYPLVFISDLHLDRLITPKTQQFERAVDWLSTRAEAVYILGDLWDAWLGDDSLSIPSWQGYASAVAAIRRLTQAIPVYYLVGNRDFVAGEALRRHTGMSALSDPSVINLPDGRRALLTHGDIGCLGDTEHVAMIPILRAPTFISSFLNLPMDKRVAMHSNYVREHDQPFWDIDPEWVRQQLAFHHANLIIHGHTHQPFHHLATPEHPWERFVLHNWDERPGMLAWQNHALTLIHFDTLW